LNLQGRTRRTDSGKRPKCIKGKLLNVAAVTVRLNVANEVRVFIAKGICIGQRTKAKDYYDLYMLAKHFKEGPKSLAESLGAHMENGLLKEALANIDRYFESTAALGPTHTRVSLRSPGKTRMQS
jgi:hypothetical protein